MRRILAWTAVVAAAATCPGAAYADDAEILRRLDALAAAMQRVETSTQGLVARLDRIDARLSEIDVRLERLERAQGTVGVVTTTPRAAPSPDGYDTPPPPVVITNVILSNKRIDVRADTGDEYLRIDVEGTPKGLLKAARLKARISLLDRFGTAKKTFDVTTEVIRPGERLVLKGPTDAPYWRLSRSAEEDLWLRGTDIRELRGQVDLLEVVYGVDVQSGPVR